MANFDEHSRWAKRGAVIGFVAIAGFILFQFRNPEWAVGLATVAAVLVYVFGIFPDTDHHAAIPYRYAVKLLTIVTVVAIPALVYLYYGVISAAIYGAVSAFVPSITPAIATGGATLVAIIGAILVMPTLVNWLTGSHRSWTHSWRTALGVAVVLGATAAMSTGYLTTTVPVPLEYVAAVVMGAVLFGFAIHFKLDGILTGK